MTRIVPEDLRPVRASCGQAVRPAPRNSPLALEATLAEVSAEVTAEALARLMRERSK